MPAGGRPRIARRAEAPVPEDLAARRVALVFRSQQLREQLAQDAASLAPVWGVADQVRQGFHWLKAHPVWVGLAVAVWVIAKPKRLWTWGGRAWGAWKAWRRVRSLWASAQG